MQPARLRSPETAAALRALAPDVNLLVAYGKLIPLELLNLGKYFINLHFSLLPRYRGAAPVQRALLDGCTATGVTVQHLAAALDAGDIILQHTVPIEPGDTTATLLQRCVTIGAPLVQQALALLARGAAPRTPQDHAAATQAPKLTQQDGFINWHDPACAIVWRVCACNPWPGATTWLHDHPVKLWLAAVSAAPATGGAPGLALLRDKRVLVGSGAGVVELIEVQPAGRTRMSAAAFMAGVRQPGVQFGAAPPGA